MKTWQVYSSDNGVNWHRESGWLVWGDNKQEALEKAKRQQDRGGGRGHVSVEEFQEDE